MALADDLEQAAQAASGYGEVTAVLAAEPAPAQRAYLVALGEDEAREWLVLDAAFSPVADREAVREVASIVVLCELAGELAGGGQLEELRARLAEVRMTEQPPGIEQAEEAALALERAIGAPPVVASPAYLDAVGVATKRSRERSATTPRRSRTRLAAAAGTVEAFVAEVESRHVLPLR